MTVKELIEYLSQFPPDTRIVEKRYSDVQDMELSDWDSEFYVHFVKGSKLQDWYRTYHQFEIEKLTEKEKSGLTKVIRFAGN